MTQKEIPDKIFDALEIVANYLVHGPYQVITVDHLGTVVLFAKEGEPETVIAIDLGIIRHTADEEA